MYNEELTIILILTFALGGLFGMAVSRGVRRRILIKRVRRIKRHKER